MTIQELPVDHQIGPVRFTRDGERWHLRITDVPALRRLLGEDLFVHFARAFAVADRLISLHSFMYMTFQHHQESVAFDRDLLTVVLLIWGVTREATDTISGLDNYSVGKLLSDKAPWLRLVELKARWNGSGLQSDARHKLAFHFDRELTRKGIARWCRERPEQSLTIGRGDGMREMEAAFPIGLDLVAYELGLDEDTVRKFASERKDDHFDFASNVQDVFIQVLKAKLAETEDKS